jgi:hypothetical protein
MRHLRRNYRYGIADKFLALPVLPSCTPLRLHVSRLKPDGDLHAIMDVLIPHAARLLGRVNTESVGIEPEVILWERIVGSNKDYSLLR